MGDSVSFQALAHSTLLSETEITKEMSPFCNQGYAAN